MVVNISIRYLFFKFQYDYKAIVEVTCPLMASLRLEAVPEPAQ